MLHKARARRKYEPEGELTDNSARHSLNILWTNSVFNHEKRA